MQLCLHGTPQCRRQPALCQLLSLRCFTKASIRLKRRRRLPRKCLHGLATFLSDIVSTCVDAFSKPQWYLPEKAQKCPRQRMLPMQQCAPCILRCRTPWEVLSFSLADKKQSRQPATCRLSRSWGKSRGVFQPHTRARLKNQC